MCYICIMNGSLCGSNRSWVLHIYLMYNITWLLNKHLISNIVESCQHETKADEIMSDHRMPGQNVSDVQKKARCSNLYVDNDPRVYSFSCWTMKYWFLHERFESLSVWPPGPWHSDLEPLKMVLSLNEHIMLIIVARRCRSLSG